MDTTSSLPINISDRMHFFDLLNKLQPVTKALFGIMSPQHMVEHLAFSIRFSNGKEPQQMHYSTEQAVKIKSFMLYATEDLPMGFKSPVLPIDSLLPLKYISLAQAIENLKLELNDFDTYFQLNPSAAPIHPVTGELTHKEWIAFHNRHFVHHFKQFGLL